MRSSRFMVVLAALASGLADGSAGHGLPSQARLAEMGLAGMEILSDAEAATVCVSGRPPNPWGDLYPFIKGVSRLQPVPARAPFLLR
jgi:hypothetical protein